ncbi:MAG: hypothetical protein PHH98_01815 [Candidatus Gracilibacteria bacterium]|nr:hypothetical protein [Candidatus Gracilibacteria bacterium]
MLSISNSYVSDGLDINMKGILKKDNFEVQNSDHILITSVNQNVDIILNGLTQSIDLVKSYTTLDEIHVSSSISSVKLGYMEFNNIPLLILVHKEFIQGCLGPNYVMQLLKALPIKGMFSGSYIRIPEDYLTDGEGEQEGFLIGKNMISDFIDGKLVFPGNSIAKLIRV